MLPLAPPTPRSQNKFLIGRTLRKRTCSTVPHTPKRKVNLKSNTIGAQVEIFELAEGFKEPVKKNLHNKKNIDPLLSDLKLKSFLKTPSKSANPLPLLSPKK